MRFQYLLGRRADHIVHDCLVKAIVTEFSARVAGFCRPRRMIYQFGVLALRPDIFNEGCQCRLHRVRDTIVRGVVIPMISGSFLHADECPVFVSQGVGHPGVRGLGHGSVHNLAVAVSGGVRSGVRGVFVKRTSTDIKVADDHFLPLSRE